MGWSSMPLPTWLRSVGAAVGRLVVPPLLFWIFHHLGKNLTDTFVTRREPILVTSDPYRWVRQPFFGVAFPSTGPPVMRAA
jgi:protein-S-isoprenylcysteine O-methyltransferase Ste14